LDGYIVTSAEPTAPTLEQQMRAAMAGDARAYEDALKAISQRLAPYLARKLAAKDRDDVLQDILLSIHRSRHTYDNARPLMPWVMAIAHYRLQDHWRRHYGHGFKDMADIEELKNILSADETESLERHEDIRRVIEELPPKQRAILGLMYGQDKSVQEVADLMNMSVSAVKVAAHRSYKVFRKRLKGE
jgi:RNA polymerase sigma-70 factor, ECF subfamily